jgi:adenine deaminase
MKICGKIVDVHEKRIFPGEVLVERGRILAVRELMESPDCYILPGFIDAHVHVESSMLVPSEFARACVAHGTVGVVSDPHEIANVCGIDGVEFMIRNGRQVPFHFFFGAPSCVPATTMEQSGAVLDAGDVEQLLQREDIFFLSEMMNFPGVVNEDEQVVKKLLAAKNAGKPIDGHAPGLTGKDLDAYISQGISTDHECMDIREAREKINKGMNILIREGSAARNFEELIPLIEDYPDMIMFCTDDSHPDTLLSHHINGMVQRAVSKGYDLFSVLRAASLNPVKHYGLNVGMLRSGDSADFIVVKDLKTFELERTYINGAVVFEHGRLKFPQTAPMDLPNRFFAGEVDYEDLQVQSQGRDIRVIGLIDGELYTRSEIATPLVSRGLLVSDTERDILKLVVYNRYESVKPQMAFVRGMGIKKGAIASSIAHDSHNIVALGVNDWEIAKAINKIIENKGGLSLCDDDNVLILPLPVAGLMSDKPASVVAHDYRAMEEAAKEMGAVLKAPFMALSFLSLLVIPELKLGDKGLFDVTTFRFTSLFV